VRTLTVALFLITASIAPSQPAFEAASVKSCKPDMAPEGRSGGESPSRLHIVCQPVIAIIQTAYDRWANGKGRWGKLLPIQGGPAWISSELYSVDATAAGLPGEGLIRGPMLQTLLEDRFQLKIHRETREVPVYDLTAVPNRIKLQPFPQGSCTPRDFSEFPPPPVPNACRIFRSNTGPNVSWTANGITLDEFCILLSSEMDRPVTNKTGIDGRFNLVVQYAPDSTPADLAAGPSIFSALTDQLGLKLVAAKGPGDFLVIDRIERPTAN
jgi:uncharacterized protein (TIGR03435 family)